MPDQRTTYTLTDSWGQVCGSLIDDPEQGVWVEYADPNLGAPARYATAEEAITLLESLWITVTADD